VRRQRRASSASCAGLQSRQLHADTGSAGGNQALVVDRPAGKTRQNWCQGRAPWPLRYLPDGRGRGAEGIVPRDSAADRGTTTTATTSACVRRRWSCVQERLMGGVCPNASESGQISPRPPSGLPEVTVAVRIALLPCREPGNPRISKPVPGSSGESRLTEGRGRMNTQFWVIQAFNGISYGALLFLVGSGVSLIFGVMRMVDLAHGAYFLWGGSIALSVINATGSWARSLPVAALAVAVLGMGIDRVFLRPLGFDPLRQLLL